MATARPRRTPLPGGLVVPALIVVSGVSAGFVSLLTQPVWGAAVAVVGAILTSIAGLWEVRLRAVIGGMLGLLASAAIAIHAGALRHVGGVTPVAVADLPATLALDRTQPVPLADATVDAGRPLIFQPPVFGDQGISRPEAACLLPLYGRHTMPGDPVSILLFGTGPAPEDNPEQACPSRWLDPEMPAVASLPPDYRYRAQQALRVARDQTSFRLPPEEPGAVVLVIPALADRGQSLGVETVAVLVFSLPAALLLWVGLNGLLGRVRAPKARRPDPEDDLDAPLMD